MDTEDQIRNLFQQHGMNLEQIRYNPDLDYYHVNIGVEGTDDRFLEGVGEIGSEGPVGQTVDTTTLQGARHRIDSSQIDDGTVDVMNMMKDSHFQIQIE